MPMTLEGAGLGGGTAAVPEGWLESFSVSVKLSLDVAVCSISEDRE